MSFRRFIPFLVAFVLPLLLVYAWWGGFNPVDIREAAMRGPYTYAYLEHSGDYSKLPDRQAKVARALGEQGIAAGLAISVLYSNPDLVNVNERRARTGYLVPVGSRVREPLRLDTIPARPVVLVEVRAAVLLAPSRAYQALDRYAQARGLGIRMPTVEIYAPSGSTWRMGTLSVEMPQ
jgi:hypothetical protein